MEPKEGETIVINGAAGAVGSIVGQLAKIKVIATLFKCLLDYIIN
jgi:NADPH-dependent curcumin reductase CurA